MTGVVTETDLRREVRQFLHTYGVVPRDDAWMRGFDRAFSRELGRRGWLGMTVPASAGGHGRSYVDRFAVTEELLRGGAPCAAHWLGDRQVGPVVARFGSARLCGEVVPGVVTGELVISVAISEAEAGSDVAAIGLRAEPDGDRWRLNGRKLWTTGAHEADLIYVVARTDRGDDPHEGLTELLVPTDTPGLEIRPIEDMVGASHFNELEFDDAMVPAWRVVGEVGQAWRQVMAQLDLERAGPERALSTFPTFERLAAALEPDDPAAAASVGRLASHYHVLRAMSRRVAAALDDGRDVGPSAAMVKDVGGRFEQWVPEVAAELSGVTPRVDRDAADVAGHLGDALRFAPAFTLRGGSSEILAEIVRRRVLGAEHKGRTRAGLLTPPSEEVAAVSEIAEDRFAAVAHGITDPWAVAVDAGWLGLVTDEAGDAATRRSLLAAVLRAQGRSGVSTPTLEQLVAHRLLLDAGWEAGAAESAAARSTCSDTPHHRVESERTQLMAAFARSAERVIQVGDRVLLGRLWEADVHERADLAGAPLDDVVLPVAACGRLELDPAAEPPELLLALGRAAAVAGACRRALDLALEHASTRKQFGRPLLRFQAVGHRLARAAMACEALDVAVEVAARSGDADSIAAARVLAAEVAREVSEHAHQVHGAIGVTAEHELHRVTLRARAWAHISPPRGAASALGRSVIDDLNGWWERGSQAIAR